MLDQVCDAAAMMRSIAALDIDCEPGQIVPSRPVIEVENAEHIHLLEHMRLLANTTHYKLTFNCIQRMRPSISTGML